jgi:release factor glutamine methyltransferase
VDVVSRLAAGGFVAAEEEAAELAGAAGGDRARLEELVARRLAGEPLAWITGGETFCGVRVRVSTGVYVPRPHSEPLAERAAERLPSGGVAVDLCTGSGAVAAVLRHRRPDARVLASDIDERSVACARSNGVDAVAGDLFAPLPAELRGAVDLVVGVVPYVPTPDLPLLQRDTFTFETTLGYDGGPDGLALLRRAAEGAAVWLRPGGALLLELGGRQGDDMAPVLAGLGFSGVAPVLDEDGDVRGVEATLSA